jgi:hypothetical protein
MKRPAAVTLLLTLFLISAAFAQTTLELKRNEGASTTRTTYKVQQTLTIAGMPYETGADIVSTSRATTGKRGADGTLRVVEKAEGMIVNISLPGAISVKFDSSKPEEAKSDIPQIQAIIDSLKATSGATYTYVIGKDNRVTAVEGTEKVLAALPAAVAEAAKPQLDPEILKQQANQEIDRLPDVPVIKGTRWSRKEVSHIGGGQTLAFEAFYEYLGTIEKDGKTLDKISVYTGSVTYAIEPNASLPVKVVSSDLKIDSSAGTLLFDRERGQVVESSNTMRITGPMVFSINNMELGGKLDLTMEGSSVVK